MAKKPAPAKRPSGTRYRLDRGQKNMQLWFTPSEFALMEEAARLDGRPRSNLAKYLVMEYARKTVEKRNPEFLKNLGDSH